MSLSSFTPNFFTRPAVQVARDLLGARLVRRLNGVTLAGVITETEAYQGEEDLACHARAGRTPRTAVMYGPPARAYVYFTYGMHWLLNVVTSPEDTPAAVLIRAVHPTQGLEVIAARRAGVKPASWADGPGKLCRAFAIDGAFNGANLLDPTSELYLQPGEPAADKQVSTGPRVGIQSTPEPWRSIPWRFILNEG